MEKISFDEKGQMIVPNRPVITYIEGDGIGMDITPCMIKACDAAVDLMYKGQRKIHWLEIFAGEKAAKKYAGDHLPEETLEQIKKYHINIKGPLTTPVGQGIRSINVTIRQKLDLYACFRPIRYYKGVPSPVKRPEDVDMAVFRENSEDIYAGIEFEQGSAEANEIIEFLEKKMNVKKIRFPKTSAIGIKPISKEGTERFIEKVMEHILSDEKRHTLTLVHKGNIMKYTEGGFCKTAYEYIKNKYGAREIDGGPWLELETKTGRKITINDAICDAFLQKILIHPKKCDVIATMNLNGDYISDALAAQVGGIGISPGVNIGNKVAVFEATHGTAPKYAGMNKVNPCSIMLSAKMMLDHMGWHEAADILEKGIEKAIEQKEMTYDFAKVLGIKPLSTTDFTDRVIDHMHAMKTVASIQQ